YEEIAEIFGVTERYIYKLLRQRRERGDVEPKGHSGGAKAKLDEEKLDVLTHIVSEQPDATLEELRQELKKKTRVSVSISTVWRGLEASRLTLKKRRE
ncbi:MAG: helix-turn-helix domain-containing protein, partial [Nitrososphaerales archaeon]